MKRKLSQGVSKQALSPFGASKAVIMDLPKHYMGNPIDFP